MKRIASIGALVLGMLNSQIALSAVWVDVGESSNGTLVEIDTTSVVKTKDIHKAWVRYNYTSPQAGDYTTKFAPFQSSVSLTYFDCKGRRIATGKQVVYRERDGRGDVLSSASFKDATSSLDDVTPGTLGEAALRFVCSPR